MRVASRQTRTYKTMLNYLAEIIDSANEGIYVTDRDRRFQLWNKAAERISGYGKDEVIGRSCFDNILNHIDSEKHELCMGRCPLLASIQDGVPRGPVVVYLRHKNGTRIAVEVKTAPVRNEAGDIIGGVEIFQDVTERLEQERLLKERKEKLETVLNNIGDGILFLDTEGELSVVNRACADMFSLADSAKGSFLHTLPEDMPIRHAFSAMEAAYRDSAFLKTKRLDEQCPEGQGRFRCWTAAIDRSPQASGSRCYTCPTYKTIRSFLEQPQELDLGERSISVISSFLEFMETNDLWEIVVFHDVTAEKLDAALKVAGAAAHELRQPLQAIVILAGMIEEELRSNTPLRKNIKTLLKSCDRMDHIIQKMSEITRYRTKDYLGGRKILDLEHSSDTGKHDRVESFDSAML